MTRPLDIDRVLEDWLAEGPSRFPDSATQATIDRLDDIRQRRPSRLPGSTRMNRLLISATGIAAAMILAVVGFTTYNGGSGFGSPSGTVHTSERHGYSVLLRDGWTVEERTGTWRLGEFFEANTESGVDYFERLDPNDGPPLYVYLSSQPIPASMTFDAWVATHDAATRATQPCFSLLGPVEDGVVDGEHARIAMHRCEDFDQFGAWTTVQTMVAHGGRGYAIYLWPTWRGNAMPTPDELKAEAARWLAEFRFAD
jgi:hypothetical protein